MQYQTLATVCVTFVMVAACASGSESTETFNTSLITDAGDGDGDTDTGEGDGDPTTTTTTGDGDPTTTTGDGDPTTTTGDGDPTTGDGDGDVQIADMIDNFEDGDGALIPNAGRQGYWYVFNDGSETGSQTPASDMVVPAPGGASGTSMAMHTTGTGFTVWGGGVGVDFNNVGGDMGIKMIYDVSAYTGIVLMARGNGQVRASVQIEATIPPEEGGTCMADCDPHGRVLALTNDWQQFTLPFDQLTQEGWGTPAQWDTTRVVGMQLKVGPSTDFDYWIDEVGFY